MVSPWFVFNLIKICNRVFRVVLPLLHYYLVLTTSNQFLRSETGFQSITTILRTGIFEFLYCGNNTNPSLKLWDILWIFGDHTDKSTNYVFIKQLIPTGYMNLAAPLNTFVSTLIFKRILLNKLIIQGQRKKFKSLAGKTVSLVCFHFPLSTVTLVSKREHTTWAAFDHHLVYELRNCTNLRSDFPI